MALPAKRDSKIPSPGDIMKFKGLADVVVEAKAQKRCAELLEEASKTFRAGMKAWIVSAHYLRTIRDERLHHHFGYSDFKRFLEERFSGGRTTAFEYMKIAGAFPLPRESTMVDSKLPALYDLDWHKLSTLSRLPEEHRIALMKKGKFYITVGEDSEWVTLGELQKWTREEVSELVDDVLSNGAPRMRRGEPADDVSDPANDRFEKILQKILFHHAREIEPLEKMRGRFEKIPEAYLHVFAKRLNEQARKLRGFAKELAEASAAARKRERKEKTKK